MFAPIDLLHDSDSIEESELVAKLVVAASETDERLAMEQIDDILAVVQPRPT